ncbi:MAG: hypothetical protein HRU77_06180 [Gammaproteobacteria bacterium]|nr:MAG: hypothetical protein HRU77_06180 [Gammaproteobacteria bacterium]
MTDREDHKKKIIDIIKSANNEQEDTQPSSISVNGNGNMTAGRDLNINPIIQKKVVVKTGEGAINAQQKAEIQTRLKAWIDSHNSVKKTELTYPAAWGKFKKRFKVNSYHELHQDLFEKAVKWLNTQKAIIQSMKSAPKKDPTFRPSAIRFIKARCKELGDEFCYGDYIQRRFSKTSLADLDDDELRATRAYISKKKPI